MTNAMKTLSNTSFGVYIHIPYCLQRCTYCDFATYEYKSILPPHEYVELLKKEIQLKTKALGPKKLDTIYFGGGTPSLIEPQLIVAILNELEKNDFKQKDNCEVTIEINPATITKQKLQYYLDHGVNRFSVGAQTFSDRHLKAVHREHNAAQTRETLDLLKSNNVNYSFDLLFALPNQTTQELELDLEIIKLYSPPHLSPYCLTVPEGHPLSHNRPLEDEQIKMFELIESSLKEIGLLRYEISNFSKPNFESRHNMLYWTYGDEYVGFGLSAHSYLHGAPHGMRFWNVNNITTYSQSINWPLPSHQIENLEQHQALTDYCHISLRLSKGLSYSNMISHFDKNICSTVKQKLDLLTTKGLLSFDNEHWSLTPNGLLISNFVFSDLTFLKDDLTY